MITNGAEATTAAADLRLSTWSFLWASAILFSLVANPGWFVFLSASFPSTVWFREVALATLAVATMLRPGLRLLSLLALAQLAQTAFLLPEVANHRLITAFVNLSLLAAVVGATRTKARFWPSTTALWELFLPVARWIVIVVYLFAFFAKLNADFLTAGTSCAAQFYRKIGHWLPLLPQTGGATETVAWATLLAEAVLPLLLVMPRYRRSGVILGILFHLTLSFDLLQHLVNFSSVMFALLVLFLPDQHFFGLRERWDEISGESDARLLRLLACVSFLALVVIAFRAIGNDGFAIAYYALRQTMFVGYGVVLLAIVALVTAPARVPGMRLPRSAPQIAIVALAVVNGLSPYLGLKTRTSFNMYSNLRVEAHGSNHFLVPRSLDLLGMLSDTIVVEQTNDPVLLSRGARPASAITWFEFASYVNRASGVEVWYRRNGERRYLNAAEGIGMPPPPPWLLRKLLFFRAVGDDVARECLW